MPIPPQYGVGLPADSLTSQVPVSVLYGVTPSNQFIPIQVDSEGRLSLATGIQLVANEDVDIGDVDIKAMDYSTGDDVDMAAVFLGAGNGWGLKVGLFDGSNQLVVNSDGSINARSAPTYGATANVFNQYTVSPTVETIILSYTVPIGHTLAVQGFYAWGDYDGEFLVYVNGSLMGGGRTSCADRTLFLDYSSAPILAAASSVVTITVTHYAPGARLFRVNLLGGLI